MIVEQPNGENRPQNILLTTSVQEIRMWEQSDLIAAKVRLKIAHRYQNDRTRLNDEFPNLCLSQEWLAARQNEETAHLYISYTEQLYSYLQEQGHNADLLQWCKNSIRACEYVERNPCFFYYLLGDASHALGRWNDAIGYAEQAIQLSQGSDEKTHARAMLLKGRIQFSQGAYTSALTTLAQAEILLLQQKDYENFVRAKLDTISYYVSKGDIDAALAGYRDIEAFQQEKDEMTFMSYTLLMIGVSYRRKKEYAQAKVYFQRALQYSEARQHRRDTATNYHHLAWFYLEQGDLHQAQAFCDKALTLYKETGDNRGVADAYDQIGCIMQKRKSFHEAATHFHRSLDLSSQLGSRHGIACSLRRLGVLYMRHWHLFKGIRYLYESFTAYHNLGILSRKRVFKILKEIWG